MGGVLETLTAIVQNNILDLEIPIVEVMDIANSGSLSSIK